MALLTGLCAVSAAALPRNGTGPTGFLTVDDSPDFSTFRGTHALATEASGLYNSCLGGTGASTEDCRAVLDDIRGNPSPISVAAGYCLNWYEGSCLGRVCGGQGTEKWTGDGSWIADMMDPGIVEPCISKAMAGVVSDCDDVASNCGSYHFYMQSYNGGM
ncbi:hypothetical protein GGR53DRAFT_463117 [Hypoxylon sp. FL1150]|nr:hypothetical protein GGR53DRAFT_463117 [Hypoxylon sp. FL1150]